MKLATEVVNVSQPSGLSISFLFVALFVSLKFFVGGGKSHSKVFYNIHELSTANRRHGDNVSQNHSSENCVVEKNTCSKLKF